MAKAVLSSVFEELTGAIGNVVLKHTPNGIVVARRAVSPSGDSTAQQRIARGLFVEAARAWTQLSDRQRAAWADYVAALGDAAARAPQTYYCKCAWYRLAAGLPAPGDAPRSPSPPEVIEAALVASGDPSELAFEVYHLQHDVSDCLLYVEATPPLASPARKPRAFEFRAAAGVGPESFAMLPPSGGVARVGPVRFEYSPGACFGLRLRTIGPDGQPAAMAWQGILTASA